MTEKNPTTKKLLVTFDQAKPDGGAGDFLVPVREEGRPRFVGLRSGKAADLGRMVFVGKEVTVNDLFAKLVDSGHKVGSVDQTVGMLGDYLEMLQEHKIGNVIEIQAVAGGTSRFRLVKVANTPSGAMKPRE